MAQASTAGAPPPAATGNDATSTARPLKTPIVDKTPTRRERRDADDAYLAGAAFLDKNEPEKAEKAFMRASALDPEKTEYALAVAIAREHRISAMVQQSTKLDSSGDHASAIALLAVAGKLDPENAIVNQHLHPDAAPRLRIEPELNPLLNLSSMPGATADDGPRLATAIRFAPEKTTQSFHFRADTQEFLRRIYTAYGIRPQMDTGLAGKSVRIDVDDVDFQHAAEIAGMLTQTFAVPLTTKTAYILKDTNDNRENFQHQSMETIYLPGLTNEQQSDLGNLLRSVFDLKHISTQPGSGTMVLRAPEDLLKTVNYELAELLDGGSEVVLEMKLFEVDKTRSKNIGVTPPGGFSAFNLASQAEQVENQYSSQIAAAIANGLIPASASPLDIAAYLISSGLVTNPLISGLLGTIGNSHSGLSYTGVSASTLPVVNMALNSSETKTIDNVTLRVGDRQSATFRSGTRYPIITASFSATGVSPSALASLTPAQLAAAGLTSASAAALASQTSVPQIQYEDLGLTLKATPTVQRSGDITLLLDLKIEALAGSSLNSIPVLASRAMTSNATIHEGQTAVLVTSMSKQESGAVNGLPGLSELPGFQSLTDKDTELDTTELVITLTPRLVRRGHNDLASVPIRIGGGTKDEE